MLNAADNDESPPLTWLVPDAPPGGLGEFLGSARTLAAAPFDPARMAALDALSRALLAHPRLRRDPAGVALGFWLRKAHLASLEQDYRARAVPGRRVAAGLVFHVAPANVDTMFLYSWALAFLAGNANVVRLTTRRSALMDDLLGCLGAVVREHPEPSRGNLFLTYGHDDALTAQLSSACDCRMVWGGDDTVNRLRASPLSPHATERSFASKRSLSVISSSAYLRATESERGQLADRMASDLAPFGQMACSSPQAVYWIGEPDLMQRGLSDFGPRLQAAMAGRLGAPDLGWAVRRLNHGFAAAADGSAGSLSHHPHTTQVAAVDAAQAEPKEPCGVGLLRHAPVASAAAVVPLLGRSHQTLTYFGLTEAERDLLAVGAGAAGLDRIVPIGRALDFGPYWDGFDLWCDLTRIVVVA